MNLFQRQCIQLILLTTIFYFFHYEKENKIQIVNDINDRGANLERLLHEWNEYYQIIENHKNEIQNSETEHFEIDLQETDAQSLEIEFDYLYLFKQKYMNIYFYRYKEDDKERIYFDGMKHISQIKLFQILKSIKNKGKIECNVSLFEKNGILYKINKRKRKIVIDKRDISFYESFIRIRNKKYLQCIHHPQPYLLKLSGYSLGGYQSQYFLQKIQEDNEMNLYRIEVQNIESWFFGDNHDYDELKNIVSYKNIFNFGSFMHIYQKIFQKFHKIDKTYKNKNDFEYEMKCNMIKPFPFGVIGYFKHYHLINNRNHEK